MERVRVEVPEPPSTVEAVQSCCRKAVGAAVRCGRLPRNPADLPDPPRVPSGPNEMEKWDIETLRWFLAATADDRLHALWVLLATTGVRGVEAVDLRWEDIDLDAGRLRVVQTILSINGELLTSEPKTAKGQRPIALDQSTVTVLREHRKRMLESHARRRFLRCESRRPPPRLVPTAGDNERHLPLLSGGARPAEPDAEGPAPYLGKADSRADHPPSGRSGAPRPLHHRHHAWHLQPRADAHDQAAELVAGLILEQK